jgi:hypothetical protein
VLTVFAAEPNLQQSGRLRINLNVPWSDELGRRLDDRFGAGAAEIVKEIMDGGTSFESDGAIVEVMRFFNLAPDEWPDILDALSSSGERELLGRVDINAAPLEALLALPGVSAEHAAQILAARQALSADERATIVWPVLRGIVPAEAFGALADRITVRSWKYRVRVASGQVAAENPRGPLVNPLIHEVVLDLTSPGRGRIAELRDVTMLDIAAALAGSGDWNEDVTERYNRGEAEGVAGGGAGAGGSAGVDESADEAPRGADAPPQRRRVARWRAGG